MRTIWLVAVLTVSVLTVACAGSPAAKSSLNGVDGSTSGGGAGAGSGAGGSGNSGSVGAGSDTATRGTAGLDGGGGPDGLHSDAGVVGNGDAATRLGDAAVAQPCGAFPAITDLSAAGSFGSMNAAAGSNCQIYRPTTLGQNGVRHPVILWANGTGGPTTVYAAAFEYWTSHGFIVVAGNSSNGQGSGAELLGCLDYILQQNTTAGSVFEGKVCPRVAASGHSQGGGGALMVGVDPRVNVTAPLMPYIQQGFGGYDQASIPKQNGPMLLLSGTNDTIAVPAVNQQPVFDMTNVPVFWANLVGGDHVAVSLNGLTTYREVMLAWYRLQLMGDETFRGEFYGPSCKLCGDSTWKIQRKGIN